VFCVVRVVHKFGFRPDIHIKGENSQAVLETRVSEMIFMYFLPPPPTPECYGNLPMECRSSELL
jgi:hypothetical protein